MRHRLAAAVALWLLASCGSPPTPSMTGAPPSTPIVLTPTPLVSASVAPSSSTSPPSSSDVDACRLSPTSGVTPPVSLVSDHGNVVGITDGGDLIVLQSHFAGVGDRLSLLDPRTGAVSPVVSRPIAKSQEAATSQIGGSATGNADWIVWEEVGFSLEHADWRIWALDRRTGAVRKVASFDRGPDGLAPPGFASDISLEGDIAAWSAPAALSGDKVGERIYVADLRAKTVRRLNLEARWPALIARTELIAAVQAGTDPGSGKVLAQPATIEVTTGTSSRQGWIKPARLLALAASLAGVVVTRLVSEASADNPATVAEVVTQDAAGATQTFPLPTDWGPVIAGAGFLGWTDARHLWLLPSGQAEPTVLLETADDSTQIQVIANGGTLLWRAAGFTYDWATIKLATVLCP